MAKSESYFMSNYKKTSLLEKIIMFVFLLLLIFVAYIAIHFSGSKINHPTTIFNGQEYFVIHHKGGSIELKPTYK